jgi:hypothetical protein
MTISFQGILGRGVAQMIGSRGRFYWTDSRPIWRDIALRGLNSM